MEVALDPYTGEIQGEGTNIGMPVVKRYTGTLIGNVMNCRVHFPSTDQRSMYKGVIDAAGNLELKIEIVDPGKTSGVKGDYKFAKGKWEELLMDDFPKPDPPKTSEEPTL